LGALVAFSDQESRLPEVLVIDDNPTQLCVREAVLRGAGLSVVTANSAEQALDLLRNQVASSGLRVILTDHVLTGASGDVFVRELRKFSSSVPVLVISGMDEAEQEYAGLGVTFLHKPCAPEDLIAEVREALKRFG
jgi:DNA-binding response OmpR family regulator